MCFLENGRARGRAFFACAACIFRTRARWRIVWVVGVVRIIIVCRFFLFAGVFYPFGIVSPFGGCGKARGIAWVQRGEVTQKPGVERADELKGMRVYVDDRDEALKRLTGEIQICVFIKQGGILEILIDHGGRQLRRLGDHGLQDFDLRFQIRDLAAHAFQDGSGQHAGGHVFHDRVDLSLQAGDLPLGGRDAAAGLFALALHVGGERLDKLGAYFRTEQGCNIIAGSLIELIFADGAQAAGFAADICAVLFAGFAGGVAIDRRTAHAAADKAGA